jgi:hypothetical protein
VQPNAADRPHPLNVPLPSNPAAPCTCARFPPPPRSSWRSPHATGHPLRRPRTSQARWPRAPGAPPTARTHGGASAPRSCGRTGTDRHVLFGRGKGSRCHARHLSRPVAGGCGRVPGRPGRAEEPTGCPRAPGGRQLAHGPGEDRVGGRAEPAPPAPVRGLPGARGARVRAPGGRRALVEPPRHLGTALQLRLGRGPQLRPLHRRRRKLDSQHLHRDADSRSVAAEHRRDHRADRHRRGRGTAGPGPLDAPKGVRPRQPGRPQGPRHPHGGRDRGQARPRLRRGGGARCRPRQHQGLGQLPGRRHVAGHGRDGQRGAVRREGHQHVVPERQYQQRRERPHREVLQRPAAVGGAVRRPLRGGRGGAAETRVPTCTEWCFRPATPT